MLRTYELILFDLDDTLLYFEDYWEEATKETFRQFSLTQSLEADQLFDVYERYSAYYVEKYHRQEISIQHFRNHRLIRALSEWDIKIDERTAHQFNELYHDISISFMRPNSELVPLLDGLREDYRIGIVSNGTVEVQQAKLKALGVESLFPEGTVIISEAVGCEKPDPRIYAAAQHAFRVPARNTLFVGDSWKNDVEGPIKSGMDAVWLNKDGRGTQPYHPSNLVAVIERLDQLGELLALHEK